MSKASKFDNNSPIMKWCQAIRIGMGDKFQIGSKFMSVHTMLFAGTFLVAYVIAFSLIIIPTFIMEVTIGQYIQRGAMEVWVICPLFKGLLYFEKSGSRNPKDLKHFASIYYAIRFVINWKTLFKFWALVYLCCRCNIVINLLWLKRSHNPGKSSNIIFDELSFFNTLGVGIGNVVLSFMCCSYYCVIVAWAIYYMISSFAATFPWENCDNWWFVSV